MIDPTRVRTLNSHTISDGPIVYWMIRDQRAVDNWALLTAQAYALEWKQPLVVVFALRPDLKKFHGTRRMFSFLSKGIKETATELQAKNISFYGLLGDPVQEVISLTKTLTAGMVICDFFPLPLYTQWHAKLAHELKIAVQQVDAHAVVPTWIASPKQEFAARTLRPKIASKLPQYLTDFPTLIRHPHGEAQYRCDWEAHPDQLMLDETVTETKIPAGTAAGFGVLDSFLNSRLTPYADQRTDPTVDGLSNLSPYLHFGQISAQRVALTIDHATKSSEAAAVFLEELIVRRELADNFCFYAGKNYNSLAGAPEWAQKTLAAHAADQRDFMYTLEEFSTAQTHDPAWNAAQQQLLQTGKMHGYMRMYWAKKILEWSSSPEEAIRIATYLNDRYELDGRDPNGYVGILWSIAGLHDRPWFDRPVYGTVRYMNSNGLARKFDLKQYIATWLRD